MSSFSRRVDWVKHNRAFIAAPLLGTIIFLACVIFIINLNKIESANVVIAEGDAYHNRMVSLLEMYRSDIASMFRQQMTFVIENYLASQCWLNLFDINNGIEAVADNTEYENDKIQRLPPFNGYTGFPATKAEDYSIQELRYHKCKYINRLINSVGRSVNGCKARCLPSSQGGPCGTSCVDQMSCMNPENGCVACQDCLNKLYGLSKILADLSRNTTFEGIDFNVSNRGEFQFVFDNDLTVGSNRAEKFTSTLMGGSLFDCGAFARDGTLSCCSVSGDMTSEHRDNYLYDYATACEQRNGRLITDTNILLIGEKISGCGNGSFFMKISMQNAVVFPVMPRFSADDAFGNQLRTGALGDSDFDIPISYPLYRYLNYSFQLYEDLANEGSGSEDNGIAQGLCVEGDAEDPNQQEGDCEAETSYYDQGFPSTEDCGLSGNPPNPSCKEELEKKFAENRLQRACEAFHDAHRPNLVGSNPMVIYVCTSFDQSATGGSSETCSQRPDSWRTICGGANVDNPGDPNPNDLKKLFDSSSVPEPAAALSGGSSDIQAKECAFNSTTSKSVNCAYFNQINAWVRFNDLSEEHRVDPAVQNRFCAFLKITHYPGTVPSNTVT